MARTTRTLVAGIIEIDVAIVPDDAAFLPFLTIANELVTECCVTNGPATAYSDERLELIERWLAAHFYAVRDPRPSSEGVSGISVSYQSAVGTGLESSHYGQTAMRLDTAGGLSRMDSIARKGGVRVSMAWLGTEAT